MKYAKHKKKAAQLPDEVFDLGVALYTNALRVFQNCDIKPAEFFALYYISEYGKEYKNGQRIILRATLAKILTAAFDYKNESGPSLFIIQLQNRGLIQKQILTAREKASLFGQAAGRKEVVILLPRGVRLLEELKKEANRLFSELTKSANIDELALYLHQVKIVAQRIVGALPIKPSRYDERKPLDNSH